MESAQTFRLFNSRKERAEREVKTLRHDIESKNKEINELKDDNQRVQDQVVGLEGALTEQKHATEGFEKRLEVVNASSVELQGQLDAQTSAMQTLETGIGSLVFFFRKVETELNLGGSPIDSAKT